MSLDRALQWTTAAVAVVGALFLALGHNSVWLPLLLGLAAVFSVLVTDVVPWLRLNRIVANLIAVTAVVWSLYDFLARSPDQQLMAISQMLVFLQVLLLFQEKTGRTYWQLMVLSLLQVVVAAALNAGLEFGLLLAMYMSLSLLALVLLCVYRDLNLDERRTTQSPASSGPLWTALLAGPEVLQRTNSQMQWLDSFRPALLTRQIVALMAASAGFTFVFFYVTPRLGDSAWQTTRKGAQSVTGIEERLTVEESGRIHQSNQVVMRAAFTHVADRKPYAIIGEPYFQGSSLTHYSCDDNGCHWHSPSDNVRERVTSLPGEVRNRTLPGVRQEYVLEMASSPWAYAVYPIQRVRRGTFPLGLRFDRIAGRITADWSAAPMLREFRYSCRTTGLTDGRQVHAVPYANAVLEFSDAEYLDELRQFDSQRFEGLEAIAQGALRTAQLEDGDVLAKAQALERHFLFSGNYRYSLNLDFERDLQLDPIEDFVVNHRSGHCEYFASALVMMLRSQGIPARMVVGYKGGEFNALGHYYVVRQKHAHAWVEAWLPTDKVPAWEIAGTPHEGGCWYRLDPTPSSLAFLEAASDGSLQDRLTDAFDYFELMWRDYVINLNSFRQQDAVVDPAAANTFGALANWVDSRAAERWLNDLAARLGFRNPGRRTSVAHRVFDWRYAALIAGGLVVAIGLANLAVVVHRRFGRWMGWNAAAHPVVNRAPAFYRRLEHLLGRLRLRRATGQTPREFAQEATKKLADGPDQQVAELPAEIVQTYYRVRFGGATLDNSETAAIEHALEKIAPAVGLASKASPAQKR